MPAAPSVGVAAHCGMNSDTTSTPAAATEEYEFLHESLAMDREILRQEGIRGTRLHPKERVRSGRQPIGGSIEMQPTYAELVNLLPRCIGAVSSSTYTLSDTVPVAFQTVIDRVAKVYTYTGCRVSRSTWRASSGGILSVGLDIEALTESVGNAGTFASLTVSTTPPFVYSDGTLTLGGSTYQVQDFSCTVDWHLKTDRYVNSVTRTDLPSLDLTVMVEFTVPYTSDTTGLYDAGGSAAVSGVTGNINFTYLGSGGGAAGVNLKFDFANLIFPAKKNPVVQNKDEIFLRLQGEARRSSTTSPLVVSLDSTP